MFAAVVASPGHPTPIDLTEPPLEASAQLRTTPHRTSDSRFHESLRTRASRGTRTHPPVSCLEPSDAETSLPWHRPWWSVVDRWRASLGPSGSPFEGREWSNGRQRGRWMGAGWRRSMKYELQNSIEPTHHSPHSTNQVRVAAIPVCSGT